MKIISDDISQLTKLDKKYDKLTAAADAEDKGKIGDKITKLRNTIIDELDRREQKIMKRKNNYLDDHDDASDSKKVARWTARLERIDARKQGVDGIIDSSLIKPDDPNADTHKVKHKHHKHKDAKEVEN